MRFVIYNGGEKVAEARDASVAARVAEMFGAGTEVWTPFREVGRIDVTGETLDPVELERGAMAASC